jgi:ligand-binding sensor domain-containing protein
MNYKLKILILFLLFIHNPPCVFPQVSDFKINTYTTENGLPHNQVRYLAQDYNGFLWVATWDGLACFDGFEFRKFYHEPGDSTSLAYFEIRDLAIDRNNIVWVIAKHLCSYDRDQDRFTTWSLASPHYLRSDQVYSITTDKDSCLFVWGDHGLERFNPATKRFDALELTDTFGKAGHLDVAQISIDEQNNLWFFITGNPKRLCRGVIQKTGSGGNLRVVLENNYRIPFPDIYVPNFAFQFRVFNNGDGRIWITSNAGLYMKEKGNDYFQQYTGDHVSLSDLPEIHSLVWSEIGKGLFYCNPATKKIFHYLSASAWNIETSFVDKDGIVWFGSMDRYEEGSGLHQIIFSKKYFHFFATGSPGQQDEMAVFSIFKDSRKNLWVGTKNNNWLLKILPDGKTRKENILTPGMSKVGRHPRSIVEDREHTLWVGYYGRLLMNRKAGEKEFRSFCPEPPDDPGYAMMKSFKHILILPDETILVSGLNTICILDPVNNRILCSYKAKEEIDIYSAYVDKNHDLWFGASGKLMHFNAGLQLQEELTVGNGLYNVEYIAEDGPLSFWLALLGGGICRFNLVTHQSISYTTRNGLSNNTTYSILKDRTGNLWISTNHGINMFNPASDQYLNFGEDDGLQIKEFNADASFLSETGEMFFGGMGGVVSFYPDSLLQYRAPVNPAIIITTLLVGQQPNQKFIPANRDQHFILARGTENITVNFSCIDFFTAGQHHLRYRLLGLSEAWNVMDGKARSVNLCGLRPGSYVFQIECTGAQGTWLNSHVLYFTIRSSLFESTWFWNAVFLVIFLLLAAITFLLFRNTKIRNAHKLAQLRLITLQGKINPHFISNSLAVIESFIPDTNHGVATEYIYELSQMMRKMIDFSGEEYIPLNEDIDLIQEYLRIEKLRMNMDFEFVINTGSIDTGNIMVAPLLIGSFVENVIKHGFPQLKSRQGLLVINFGKPVNEHLECIISDNGVGWKKSAEVRKKKSRISKGIEVVKERLNLYNMLNNSHLKLSITDMYPEEEEKGTIVTIDIPIKKR